MKRTLIIILPVVALTAFFLFAAAGLSGCDLFTCEEPPGSHKGASLDGCSESGQIMACSYSNDVCGYVLVRDGCGLTGWEESSWYCID